MIVEREKQQKTKLRSGNVRCWPRNNTFFSEGVFSLIQKNKSFWELYDFLFVDFQKSNLMDLIDFDFYINASKSYKIVLITDKHMYPIAHYMQQWSSVQIVSVIKKTTPFNQIINTIINDVLCPKNVQQKFVNINDIEFIRYCLSGDSLPLLSKKTGVNVKTLYGRRSRLLKMMGVKSLETLLL